MNQSCVFRFSVAFATAAMFLACGSAAAQVTSPGNNEGLPSSAQNAPPFQGGAADLGPVLARINALEAKVRKLEGNLTEGDLVGTYRLGYLQVSISEGADGNANHLEHNILGGTLTLSGGGAAAFSGQEIGFGAGLPGPSSRQERLTDPDEFTGTWSYTGGALVLTLTADNGQPENVHFVGGVGGRMFFTVTANPLDGTTTLIILTKDL
jgi:hypothetical protein